MVLVEREKLVEESVVRAERAREQQTLESIKQSIVEKEKGN